MDKKEKICRSTERDDNKNLLTQQGEKSRMNHKEADNIFQQLDTISC